MRRSSSSQLDLFRDEACTRCKLHKTADFVCLLGQGPTPCDIMIVGEAPGQREDASGKAFVGKAGGVLEGLLDKIGLSREDVFISNAVHCRPPDNRTPSKAEIKACRHWLDVEIKRVKPKYILILGNVPLFSFTDKTGIKKARGQPWKKDGITYFPTYHPAATLYDERLKSTLEEDFKRFGDIIDFGGIPFEKKVKPITVNTWEKFDQLIDNLYGDVSWDSETTGLYPWADGAKVISVGFGTEKCEYGIPWHHPQSPWKPTDLEKMVTRLDKVIRLRQKTKELSLVTQNGKFDHLWMRVHHGVEWYPNFDTLLAHHLYNENDLHDLEHLAQLYFAAPPYDIPLKEKQGHGPLDRHIRYLCTDLYYTRKLKPLLWKKLLEDGTDEVFTEITMPAQQVFCDAEYWGNCLDLKRMGAVERKLLKDRRLAKKALDKYGRINWGSPKQVGKLLFETLGIDWIEKTKGGDYATSESVLKRVDHPAAKTLLDYRAAEKQLSGFIDGWKPYIERTFIHPSFKLHGTVTGRLSSENPNWQQIPRDPFIRSLIIAPDGWELVEADLSQIELRIASELADERNMLAAFRRGDDVHWLTALREIARGGGQREIVLRTAGVRNYSEAIKLLEGMGPDAACEVDKGWKELRKKAKAVNFGYLFGMWWKKFMIYARDNYEIEVTEEEAQESRENFFDMWPAFTQWHKDQRRYAERNGYVRSMAGRKRHLPRAQDGGESMEKDNALRQAINSPVQSFASDLNLMAAIEVRKRFPRTMVRVVCTVHDSILMWVKKEALDTVLPQIYSIMKHPELLDKMKIKLRVPIESEISVGPWGAGKKWRPTNENIARSPDVVRRNGSGGSVPRRGSRRPMLHA